MAEPVPYRKSKGGRPCPVCISMNRASIEKDMHEFVSIREMSRRWGINVQAITKHKNKHLAQAVSMLAGPLTLRDAIASQSMNQITELASLKAKALEMLRAAENEKNPGAMLAWIQEARKTIEAQAKVLGMLKVHEEREAETNSGLSEEMLGIIERVKSDAAGYEVKVLGDSDDSSVEERDPSDDEASGPD